jgi:hypothetical protein
MIGLSMMPVKVEDYLRIADPQLVNAFLSALFEGFAAA